MTGFFAFDGDLRKEMQRLKKLQRNDPVSAQNLISNGQLCVDLAAKGQLRVLRQVIEQLDHEEIVQETSRLPCFYMAKMFKIACATRQLDLLAFMVQNGFDLRACGLGDMVHQVVDAIPANDLDASDQMQPVIRFLLDWGLDVNWQRPSDMFTALHLACQKNLYGLAYLLLVYGADVNAVAKHDEMPLLCAERVVTKPLSPQAQQHNQQLIELLVQHNAQREWRRPKPNPKPKSVRFQVASFSGACGRMFDTSAA